MKRILLTTHPSPSHPSNYIHRYPAVAKGGTTHGQSELVRRAFTVEHWDEDHLAESFQATDDMGSPPFDKATWRGMGQLIRASFPDLENVIEDIREEGASVRVVSHLIGTFTNDLDMSAADLGVIPASGKKVTFPSGTALVNLEGGKITRLHNMEAGMAGFVKALGVG